MEEVQPRSKLSIWLIGLILGPVILMLWLGRGRLALLYFLAQLLLVGLIFAAVVYGLITPPIGADFGLMSLILNLPFNIIGLIHGLMLREASLTRPWFSRWYAAIILPLAASWLIPFAVREYLYQPFNVPSTSMVPSLMVGDYVFVSKIAYGEPRRGDIVVFKLPRNNQIDYLKRLIGLPGDRIQMRDGVLHINGVAVPKQQIVDYVDEKGEGSGRPVPQYVETLPNGLTYNVLDKESNGPSDNTMEYLVPDGHYFMMGDNRDNALDSRYLNQVGYIPRENVTGPVVLVFWNSMGLPIDDRLQGYPDK